MGIGPVPAIKAVLARAGLALSDIDRFEINEAFGAQVMACARELGIDEAKLNVNGGAIAIGHPLGATGVRLALTLARELKRARLRYGIASACIGGGQGIALLIENPDAASATEELTMDIKGHAAVVTGGASGLGAATASELARAGAKVACLDVNLDGARAVAEKIGGQALHCDVTNAEQSAAALAQGARPARRGAHPHQLRRRRAGEAHRRPRRADAARRVRARHRHQPRSAPST